jgi:hypothetical protein
MQDFWITIILSFLSGIFVAFIVAPKIDMTNDDLADFETTHLRF